MPGEISPSNGSSDSSVEASFVVIDNDSFTITNNINDNINDNNREFPSDDNGNNNNNNGNNTTFDGVSDETSVTGTTGKCGW